MAAATLLALALLVPGDAPCSASPSPVAEKDRKAIAAAAMSHLESIRMMAGVKVEVRRVCAGWALVRSVPPPDTTDPAWMFLKRDGSKWTVALGPGTAFSPEDLKSARVPEGLRPAKTD